MKHQIVLWKWDQPNALEVYTANHVNVMVSMLRRNLDGIKARIICVTDDANGVTECETYPLWPDLNNRANRTNHVLPSCYRRLKLYDNATQRDMGFDVGDRIVSIDLDTLITNQLRDVLQTEGLFVGWELKGTYHERVFNGSFQMFTAGTLQWIWSEFDAQRSPNDAYNAGYLGSDQAWLSWKLVTRDDVVGLKWPQVASYPLHVRPPRSWDQRTSLVFYHGRTKPWHPQAYRETELSKHFWR